ncbi:unnamed protein product, partial [Effrenium voratum]
EAARSRSGGFAPRGGCENTGGLGAALGGARRAPESLCTASAVYHRLAGGQRRPGWRRPVAPGHRRAAGAAVPQRRAAQSGRGAGAVALPQGLGLAAAPVGPMSGARGLLSRIDLFDLHPLVAVVDLSQMASFPPCNNVQGMCTHV